MYECGNSRGISLLVIVGKVFGRVLINRIKDKTECDSRNPRGFQKRKRLYRSNVCG